jgi:RimJ/RimL family protein N-acetyltransferase
MSDHTAEVPEQIQTERLLLHPFRAEDAEQVLEAVDESRAEVGRWMPWPPWLTEAEQSRQESVRSHERWEARTGFDYTIRRRDDGRFLGAISIQDPNWAIPSFDLGYWMRTSETGKGYTSEAVRAVTRMLFEVLGAKRVQIVCDQGNTRSIRVAQTCGFQFEGRMRHDDRLPNGELGNGVYYSLIDTDDAVSRLLGRTEST